MSSSINYTAIDEDYPVPGQDNNSQGFRDNFSAIKNGLQFAKTEIEELQNKAVLKEAVGETELDNDFLGNTILNAITNRVDGSVYAATPAGSETIITPAQGDYQKITFINSHTLKFNGWSGTAEDPRFAKIRLELLGDGLAAYTINFTAIGSSTIFKDSDFPAPLVIDIDGVTRTFIDVWTTDGGTTIFMKYLGEFTS
jgi:hypothetical protein